MLVWIHVSFNLVTSPWCQGILKWFAKFWRWPIADQTTSSMLSTQKMQFEGNGCSHRNNQSKYVMWFKSPMRMVLYDVRVWGLYGCFFLPSYLGCKVKPCCALEFIHKILITLSNVHQTRTKYLHGVHSLCCIWYWIYKDKVRRNILLSYVTLIHVVLMEVKIDYTLLLREEFDSLIVA